MSVLDTLHGKHALLWMRRLPALRPILRMIDVPIWRRPVGVYRRVRLRWLRHISYHATSGGPEPELAALMVALVRCLPIRTFLDVGANFGYYSWLLAQEADQSLVVHLFEPDPSNRQLIESTLDRWQGAGTLHGIALAAEDGEVAFYRDLDSGYRGSLIADAALSTRTVATARRLDSELDVPALSDLVLVKIDVEGAEDAVLAGAPNLLARQPVVIVECLHQAECAPTTLAGHDGYRIVDAVKLTSPSDATINYLAIPPHVLPADIERVRAERARVLAAYRP